MNHPPASNQPTIAAAVIVNDGKLLLVRRRVSEGTLSWQFPAGAIEPGESPEQAAVRETQEETGLLVTTTKNLGHRTHPTTGRTMIYIACDLVSGEVAIGDPDELAEFTWAPQADLPTLVPHGFFETVQKYLDNMLTD